MTKNDAQYKRCKVSITVFDDRKPRATLINSRIRVEVHKPFNRRLSYYRELSLHFALDDANVNKDMTINNTILLQDKGGLLNCIA